MINRSLYLKYKSKHNWVESEPSYFDEWKEDDWYKSWGHGSITYPYHRVDGPARVWSSGFKEYWLNDIYFRDIKSDDEWIIKQIIE